MSTFPLRISTPDGVLYDGDVERIRVRMIDGDVCLLANHINYVSAVGAGEAVLVDAQGECKRAACIGGMLSMINNRAELIATTFEWADSIDLNRAERAKDRAQQQLNELSKDKKEFALATAKLQRALVRIQVKKNNA